ncbi:MAG: M48 family metallopeptidase [Nitrospirota bacterium]
MPREWSAWYLDGRAASRQRATVRLLPNGLYIATEQGLTLAWPYDAIRVTQGLYRGEQVRLERGGPIAEVLFIEDAAFLSGLRELAPRLASGIHDPARRTHRIVWTALAAAAAIGMVVAVFRWGLPSFAALVARWVPVSWEVRLGDAVVKHLVPAEQRCDDPVLQQRLDDVLAALTAGAASPYDFKLLVADDDALNAFAAPGGTIVILTGLLKRTTRPEELAGVIAHEIQHIVQRHSTRAILHHASAGVLVAALTGDVSGVAAFGLDAARNLGLLRYSRGNEDEADEAGMRMMVAAGIDPSGMIAFYEVLAREGPALPRSMQYLSTHPATADRVERIRHLADGAGPPRVSFGSPDEWAALTQRCRAESQSGSP